MERNLFANPNFFEIQAEIGGVLSMCSKLVWVMDDDFPSLHAPLTDAQLQQPPDECLIYCSSSATGSRVHDIIG